MGKLAGGAGRREAGIYSLGAGDGGQTVPTLHYQPAGHWSLLNQEQEVDNFLFLFAFKEKVSVLGFPASAAARLGSV